MEDAQAHSVRLAAAIPAEQPGLPRPKKRKRTDNQAQPYTHGQDSNATVHSSTFSPPIDAGKQFLEILMSIILASRALRQVQAACRRMAKERKERYERRWSQPGDIADLVDDEEAGEEQWVKECDLKKGVDELVAAVKARKARLHDLGDLPEKIPLPQYLKDNSEFYDMFNRFAWYSHRLSTVERDLSKLDLEKKAIMDNIDGHARILARSLEQARSDGINDDVAEEELTHVAFSEMDAECLGSVAWDQVELQESRVDYKHGLSSCEDAMLKYAEEAVIEAGFLPSLKEELEEEHQGEAIKADTGPAKKEVPYANGSALTHEPEGKPQGESDLQAELDAAQEQLHRLRLELDDRQQESKAESAGFS